MCLLICCTCRFDNWDKCIILSSLIIRYENQYLNSCSSNHMLHVNCFCVLSCLLYYSLFANYLDSMFRLSLFKVLISNIITCFT